MSIKDIISKAKSSDYNPDTSEPDSQDTQETSNLDTQLPENVDTQQPKKSSKKKKTKKTLNLEVPAIVGNFWMGKIKTDGGTFKKIVIDLLVRKYGLPEGFTKEDL